MSPWTLDVLERSYSWLRLGHEQLYYYSIKINAQHGKLSWVPTSSQVDVHDHPRKISTLELGDLFQKFRKVGPKFFSKKYFLRKCFIEFPNKHIFQPTFSREKKSRNVDIFAIVSLENVGRKIFLFGNSMKFFRYSDPKFPQESKKSCLEHRAMILKRRETKKKRLN